MHLINFLKTIIIKLIRPVRVFRKRVKGLLPLSTTELKSLLPLNQYSNSCPSGPLPLPTLSPPVSQPGILSLPLYSQGCSLTGLPSVPHSVLTWPKLISASGPAHVLSLCLECFRLQPFTSNSFKLFRFQQKWCIRSPPRSPLK